MDFSGPGGFIGSLVGDAMTADERKRQLEQIERNRRLYEGLPTTIDFVNEEFENLGPSAYEQIQEDPTLRDAQLRTMQGLQGIADAGGLDAGARADIAQAQAANAATSRAKTGNLLDQFTRRGMGGGPGAVVAAMQAQQANTDRAGMEGLQAAGMGAQRKLQALNDVGAMASGVRGQDYRVAGDKAGAQDNVASYNAQARQGVRSRNASRKMDAQGRSIDNTFRQADGVAGTNNDERDYWAKREKEKMAMWTGGGQAAGSAAGYAAGKFGGP